MRHKYTPVDLSKVKTYSISDRPTKMDFSLMAGVPEVEAPLADFFSVLPNTLKAKDLLDAGHAIADAHVKGKAIILMMGAHVIKVGLGSLIIRMMEEGLISAIALNGAGAIHDFELATQGCTSEDVEAHLETGMFGMVRETAEQLNRIVQDGTRFSSGLGEAIGRGLTQMLPRYERFSILANAYRLQIPVTIHVAIGTDTIHQHPSFNGEAYGRASHQDFRLLSAIVPLLHQGGVVINLGSAVILPEVFLKALTVARNLGHEVRQFTAINMDMLQHYRSNLNVVQRPTRTGDGKPISLTGHHEIMFPLLYAAIKSSFRVED